MKRFLLFILIISLAGLSCHTGKIGMQNLSYLYDKDMVPYIPQYVAYHKDDTTSVIYSAINSGGLLYKKEVNEDVFTARFSIKAELYESYEMKQLLDSNRITMTDINNSEKRNIITNLDIKAKTSGTYLLKLIFTDINKNTTVESYLNIYRNSPDCEQNFIMLNEDGIPFFKSWISGQQQFMIESNNNKLEKLFVKYYKTSFPIAAPPFSVSIEKPVAITADSIFTVPVINGKTSLITLPKKGIYFFQPDSILKSGFTVFRFAENFPEVTTIDQMIQSLRYLTSKNEYDDIALKKNKKEAIDRFWLETAGNVERAKELIKLYYNRVQDANRFFTSYIEGWKTDRGIIYIIYGPPNIIIRGRNSEKWTYGEDRNMLSITFSFLKMDNPFTDNDYSLSRSPLYKDGWYIAVDNWRR